MSDKTSFRELSQSIQHIDILRDMPDVAEDEREEMRQYIEDLTHRQADKLDKIIKISNKIHNKNAINHNNKTI